MGFAEDQLLLLRATEDLHAPMWSKAVMDFSHIKKLL